MVNKTIRCLGIALLSCSLHVAAYSGDTREQTGTVERIQVTGEYPLSYYRDQITIARDQLFTTFNNLIDDPDMHYICAKRRASGARMGKEECFDAFEDRIRREKFEEAMRVVGAAGGGRSFIGSTFGASGHVIFAKSIMSDGKKEIAELKKQKAMMLGKLHDENPQVKNLMGEFQIAIADYQQAHLKEFGCMSRYSEEDCL